MIVGAGPAGCSCAIQLAKALPELRIALVEKAAFPRDKICGDALSPDVINQLGMLSTNLVQKIKENAQTHTIKGLKIAGNGNKAFSYFLPQKMEMYTSARMDFDTLLWEHTQGFSNISYFPNCKVNDIQIVENKAVIYTEKQTFECQLVVGADGAHSVVARKLGRIEMDKEYYSAALRVYYENVQGLDEALIEFYYFKEILPGYLWIFPLPNHRANVGLGMPADSMTGEKQGLREKLQQLIENHPSLKERFKAAKPLESVKGFGLPLGGKRNNISGERFLLLGDAAWLIDPFTGEGIGNALRSGRVASEHLVNCFAKMDFSAATNLAYNKEIYRRMLPEFKANLLLKRIVNHFPFGLNAFIFVSSNLQGMTNGLINGFLWLHKWVREI